MTNSRFFSMFTIINIAVVSCFLFISFGATTSSGAAISCSDVSVKAGPCMDYAQIKVGNIVPPACCDWLKATFVEAGPSVDDKKNSCMCLKAALGDTTGLRDKRLKKIPRLCGVTLPFMLRKKPNCDRIKS